MNIIDEFKAEINEIKKQIDFIESSLLVDFSIPCINKILKENNILYSNEIMLNKEKVLRITNNAIKEVNQCLENKHMIVLDDYSKEIVNSKEFSDTKNEILSLFKVGKKENEILEEVRGAFEALSIMYGVYDLTIDYLRLYDDEEYQYFIIFILKDLYNNIYILEKQNELVAFQHFQQIVTWLDIDNLHNIYRQCFIHIIALFDASFFSMFKQLFISHFSDVVGYFKEDHVKFSDISKFNDLTELKNYIIEEQLRKCYLKELLTISQQYNSNIFYYNSKKHFGECIELINRRNSHIHNYGIVDKSYLMITKDKPNGEYNIYSKNEGDYLSIDNLYFNECITICQTILNNLNDLI